MNIYLPKSFPTAESSDVWVNVYNGSERSKVRMWIEGTGQSIVLNRKDAADPYFADLKSVEDKVVPAIKPAMSGQNASGHLWNGKLPALAKPGTYLLNVETIDMHGRKFSAQRSFRVSESKLKKPTSKEAKNSN